MLFNKVRREYIEKIKNTNVEVINELDPHLYIMMIRKSVKLKDFVEAFAKSTDGHKFLISVKYDLAKCRPEVLTIMKSMAENPERFKFDYTIIEHKFVMKDKLHDVHFRIFNGYDGHTYTATINHKDFLTAHECKIMWRVANSLNIMRKNQYRLADELKTLQEANQVFDIYKQEHEGKEDATR